MLRERRESLGIAIKVRLGKLDAGVELAGIPGMLASFDMTILWIDQLHPLTSVDPEPPTRDPFDRMLFAQCEVENLRLVTVDRAPVIHPLAWRET